MILTKLPAGLKGDFVHYRCRPKDEGDEILEAEIIGD